MIKIKQAIVVEGKYDKIKLESLVDALIIPVGGFRIFQDEKTLQLLRTLAKTVGLLVLTDSDAAGFQIRHFLRSAIREGQITDVYLPDCPGKERRKRKPSAEGLLGVEGTDAQVIVQALQAAGVLCDQQVQPTDPITKADLFADGLTGSANSSQRRAKLCAILKLPGHLSTNELLGVLNTLYTKQQYRQLLSELSQQEG